MATLLKLSPADHNMPITEEELASAEFEPGYRYELIDGRLYVTYEPDLPEAWLDKWLNSKLFLYSLEHSEVVNFVAYKARIFLPKPRRKTIPEPDLAAYHDFPTDLPLRELRWQDVSPILVAEVLSPNDAHKDLIRNVQLYLKVPSIKEYWILDGREDPDKPSLRVHRRHGQRWRVFDYKFRDVYTTRLLPGFKLRIDPRS
jgi:Uma2 family endonuclease